jgi:hypothetical protein
MESRTSEEIWCVILGIVFIFRFSQGCVQSTYFRRNPPSAGKVCHLQVNRNRRIELRRAIAYSELVACPSLVDEFLSTARSAPIEA